MARCHSPIQCAHIPTTWDVVMERDHKFEQKMRQAYVHLGQLGISKIARVEHDRVLKMKDLLISIHAWMDVKSAGAGLDGCGSELLRQTEEILSGLEDNDGD